MAYAPKEPNKYKKKNRPEIESVRHLSHDSTSSIGSIIACMSLPNPICKSSSSTPLFKFSNIIST